MKWLIQVTKVAEKVRFKEINIYYPQRINRLWRIQAIAACLLS